MGVIRAIRHRRRGSGYHTLFTRYSLAVHSQFAADGVCETDFEITKTELGKVLRCLGHQHTEEDIDQHFSQIDVNRSGSLDFLEFCDIVTLSTSSPSKMESSPAASTVAMFKERTTELREFFKLLDADGGGKLSAGRQWELRYLGPID